MGFAPEPGICVALMLDVPPEKSEDAVWLKPWLCRSLVTAPTDAPLMLSLGKLTVPGPSARFRLNSWLRRWRNPVAIRTD